MVERLRRHALIACVAMAVVAAASARDVSWGAAVIGGGLLIGISFVAITSGAGALGDGGRPTFVLLKVVGRYALLGFLAYVMIARLRLPPLGLILGASSFAVAALVELINHRRN